MRETLPVAEDYYQILGLTRQTPQEEIPRAYRELARKYHPDLNPDDQAAKEKFIEIKRAYDVLSDSYRRILYDQYGETLGGVAVYASQCRTSSADSDFEKKHSQDAELGGAPVGGSTSLEDASWFPYSALLRSERTSRPMRVLQTAVLGSVGLSFVLMILWYTYSSQQSPFSSRDLAEKQTAAGVTQSVSVEEEVAALDPQETAKIPDEPETKKKQDVSESIADDLINQQTDPIQNSPVAETVFANEGPFVLFESASLPAFDPQAVRLPEMYVPERRITSSGFHMPKAIGSDPTQGIMRPWQIEDALKKDSAPGIVPLPEGLTQPKTGPRKIEPSWILPKEEANMPLAGNLTTGFFERPGNGFPSENPFAKKGHSSGRDFLLPRNGFEENDSSVRRRESTLAGRRFSRRGMRERDDSGQEQRPGHRPGEAKHRRPEYGLRGSRPFPEERPGMGDLPGRDYASRAPLGGNHAGTGTFVLPWMQHTPAATRMFSPADRSNDRGGPFDFSTEQLSQKPEGIFSRPWYTQPLNAQSNRGPSQAGLGFSPLRSSIPGWGRSGGLSRGGGYGKRSGGRRRQSFDAVDDF